MFDKMSCVRAEKVCVWTALVSSMETHPCVSCAALYPHTRTVTTSFQKSPTLYFNTTSIYYLTSTCRTSKKQSSMGNFVHVGGWKVFVACWSLRGCQGCRERVAALDR